MPKQKQRAEKKQFTKSEIALVLELWNDKDTAEIAKELGRTTATISYIATQIRKSGYDLPRKHKRGTLRLLIGEVLKEKRLIK